MYVERRVVRLAKKEAKIINQACRMTFSVGFERCKRMVQAHLSAKIIGLLQADVVDESLIAIAADSMKKFVRTSHHSTEANKINVAIQTEEVTGAKRGRSEASHLGGASRQ